MRILVTSAWPYINFVPHIGNIIGSVLSADVIARYYRLKGEEVLFVSGSDEHGTPIEVEAAKLGIHPKTLTDVNHAKVSELFRRWEISFDNYTRTESETHKKFVQDLLMKIYRNGYIFTKEAEIPYCPEEKRFLPDRFVEGKCPYCGYERARGDQCESCGRLLEPTKLVDMRCAICGAEPIIKKTKHWYFDMPKLSEKLLEYLNSNERLTGSARNFSLRFIEEGLKARAITRDTEWGIPAPFPGAEGKTIYVWVEAVLGYISATIEYFKGKDESRWRDFWFDKDSRTLFFIGKDNIPFHTIILPALLMATHEDWVLPWNVSATEFLLFKGEKFSKSRRWGVWIDEALNLFPVDYWRYVLLAIRPENKDTNFTWKIFIEKVNSELNDTIGNFIHRAITFLNRYFDSKVPEPRELDTLDREMLNDLETSVSEIERDLENIRIQSALGKIYSLAQAGNRYLNLKEPWKTFKSDPQVCANTLYVAMQIVKALVITLKPFIPRAADKFCRMINLGEEVSNGMWKELYRPLPPGHKVNKAEVLFRKIDLTESDIERRIESMRSKPELVSIEDFAKLDLRVGRIVEAEAIPKSRKLIKLTIDIGGEFKQAVAGIAGEYGLEELKGKEVAVLVNLKPKTIFGVKSEVMILASQDDEKLSLIVPDREVKTGSKIT
ncbi:methionine--tRNA ligase [Candidatus Bathyarchaeota archaeon]|nr:MAG: methionine--tRNA ligase [Candidatus Bathyarchaeota archaeon]